MPQLDQSIKNKKSRRRMIIVCTTCHKRKIKCDKQRPCSNCIKFKIPDFCIYDSSTGEASKLENSIETKLPWPKSLTSSQSSGKPHKSFTSIFALNDGLSDAAESSSSFDTGCLETNDGNGIHHKECEPTVFHERQLEPLSKRMKPNSSRQNLEVGFKKWETISSKHAACDDRFENLPSTAVSSYPLVGAQLNDYSENPHTHRSRHIIGASPSISSVDNWRNINLERSVSVNVIDNSRKPTAANYYSSSQSTDTKPNDFDAAKYQLPTEDGSRTFLVGNNLFGDSKDKINFYEDYSSIHLKDPLRRINFGPFAWSSLMRRDNGLHLVWNHIIEQKAQSASKDRSAALVFAQQTNELTQENTDVFLSADKSVGHSDRRFQKRSLQIDGYGEFIPYDKILIERQKEMSYSRNSDKNNLSTSSAFYDIQIDRELQLIDKVKHVLPKKRVIWKLIYRYFSCVYTYMPYLDEEYFRRDVSSIIGAQSHEDSPINIVKIDKKLDMAVVGILLIVLRLAYLSLFSNDISVHSKILNSIHVSPDVQDLQYLMHNPIDLDAIEVAELCLDQFQLLRRSNFIVMQFALYLRLYYTFAPEYGDGADGGDSHSSKAILIQMAYSLGLNREPDEQCTDLKINNLSRKIWNYLVLSDLYSAYSFGSPVTIDLIYWNTKVPFYVRGGENLIDKNRDRLLSESHNNCKFLFPKLRSILNLTLDIRSRIPISQLCNMLSNIEIEWYAQCGTLRDCVNYNGIGEIFTIERNLKVKLYLAFKTFLLSVYFHIFLYYESRNIEASFFYLKKCLLISSSDFMPQYGMLFSNSGVTNGLLINPTLEAAVHKTNIIYLSSILRINFIIFHLRQSWEHDRLCLEDENYFSYFRMLCKLSSYLIKSVEYAVSAISKISHKYYYAWRITKGQKFLLKTVTSAQFYEQNYHCASSLYSIKYSTEQVQELIDICESTLSELYNSDSHSFGFIEHAENEIFNFKNSQPDTSPSKLSSDTSSIKESNLTDRQIVDLDIDKLWWQILSMKHEKSLVDNSQSSTLNERTSEKQMLNINRLSSKKPDQVTSASEILNNAKKPDTNKLNFDDEIANRFDLFSDWPFD